MAGKFYTCIENLSNILSSSRIRTSYFNRTSDAYQDIGPMRYPIEMKYKNQTLPITDHKIVFQLVDELNAINNDTYKIEFIKWYQSRPK